MTRTGVVLPDLNLQPGELYPGAHVRRFCERFWDPAWASRSGAAPGAGALCHGVLPRCSCRIWPPDARLADGHRYVDFSIRDLARQFDALGARARGGSESCSAEPMCCRCQERARAYRRRT